MPQFMSFDYQQLIITRPRGQADQLISALKACVKHAFDNSEKLQSAKNTKLAITHIPLIAIEPKSFTYPELSAFDGIIFISQHAVSHFINQLKPPSLASLTQTELYAVGSSTAAKITQLTHFSANYPQNMHSEGLLAMPRLQNVTNQKWLIVKGEGGRPLIQETFVKRGALVKELDVYRRCAPKTMHQQLQNQSSKHNLWLVSSEYALNHLSLLSKQLITGEKTHPIQQDISVITSSDRLSFIAKQKGFKIVAQSAGASDAQLVECVKNLIANRKSIA